MRIRKERIHGPYKHRARWKLVSVGPDGSRGFETFATFEEAQANKERAERAIDQERLTVERALVDYERFLTFQRCNKAGTIESIKNSIKLLVGDLDEPVVSIDRPWARRRYEDIAEDNKPDTHHNALARTKAMWKWMIGHRVIRSNPWDGIETIGKRNAGKPQLTTDESRKMHDHCMNHLDDPAAVAVLACLLTGLRASEVCALEPRDVDDDATILCVVDSKTESGKRRLKIPQLFGQLLLRHLPWPKGRHWLYYHCKRLCDEAGVSVVTPHGLRGTHGTLSTEAGATPEIVSGSLGHASFAVTARHYLKRGADESRRGERVAELFGSGELENGLKVPHAKTEKVGNGE